MTTAHIAEARIGRDRDGDWFAEPADGSSCITHYEGGTVEQADLFQIDCPDPLTPAQLAAHIAACRALLDKVDPTGSNRLPGPACVPAVVASTELRAKVALADYGRDEVAAQVAAADSGDWSADAAEKAMWRRALELAEVAS